MFVYRFCGRHFRSDMSDTKKKIPTEIYTRCVGYYRPRSAMNIGKKQEVKERKMFDVAKAAG